MLTTLWLAFYTPMHKKHLNLSIVTWRWIIGF